MKKLSRLLLVLGLALCISLTAYAEDAPAAQPTAKEPRTLTARTGTETSLWNAYAFLAQHGTAYRFAPCAVQTPADAAGTAPAEDAVAVLRLYTTYVEKDTPVNIDGHVFLAVTNNTDADLAVGGLSIAPGTSITMGTRGNNREHAGLWYNVESYNTHYLPDFYVNLTCLQLSMNTEQLAAVNAALAKADKWSAWHNLPPVCAAAPASGMLTRQCPLTTLFTTATLPCPAKNLPEQENYCIQHLHFDIFRCMIGVFELFCHLQRRTA